MQDKKNELIVFTHNDLDALGCMLGIEYKFPIVQKKYFHTNYANITEKVQEISDYVQEHGNTHILITDVSFSDNKAGLKKLYSLNKKTTLIDHHMYPDGFFDEFPNMKIIHNTKKSATLLCHEYFGNQGHLTLSKLVKLIDIYDLWQIDEDGFSIAQELNEYFWANDISFLMNRIKDTDFKLPDDYMDTVSAIKVKYSAEIEEYHKQKLVQRAGDYTLCFIKHWFNQVMLKEMDQGQKVVVGLDPYGIIKVRINQKTDYTEEQLKEIRKRLTGNAELGHMHAFTYRYKEEKSFENLMKEAQNILKVFTDVLS